jgi:hypothetical protein
MEINNLIKENKIIDSLHKCIEKKEDATLKLLSYSFYDKLKDDNDFLKIYNMFKNDIIYKNNNIRILLLCNWCSSKELCDLWNKMSKGNYTWDNIQIVYEEPYDYYCVINKTYDNIDLLKTILFRMEPHMDQQPNVWGKEWTNLKSENFKFCGIHKLHLNNVEWHLSKTYTELMTENIIKNEEICNILSTVISDKYSESGHMKRVDFIKFLETKDIKIDVYGGNRFNWKNYKGSLPYHKKDDALIPYKYTFNCENNEIYNYCTEKLYDGILTECLVFYSGCPNVKDILDEKAYVYLHLSNFEKDYEIIKRAIEENWWEQRLPYIKEAKNKILNELQFFPRLKQIIKIENYS